MKYIGLLLISMWCCSFQSTVNPTKLYVLVSNMENDNGELILDFYTSKKGFLNAEYAVKRVVTTIKDGKGIFVITDLAEGEYALVLIHDENKNGEIDTNWFGLPKEALGASNNPQGSFGPPKYEDAKFILKAGNTTMKIVMKYL